MPLTDASIANLRMHIFLPSVGSLTVTQMKSTRMVGAGDIMIVCNWAPFQISAPETFEAMVITVPGWWAFQNILDSRSSIDDLYFPATLFSAAATHVLARSLFALNDHPHHAGPGLSALAQLLHTALNVARPEPLPGSQMGRIGQILQFVCQNVESENISPQEAATALKCSVRTIHKSCSDYGISFNNLLMEVRLSVASYQLATSKTRISDIAYSSGFASLSHFCRLFKKRVGESASAYRRRYHGH